MEQQPGLKKGKIHSPFGTLIITLQGNAVIDVSFASTQCDTHELAVNSPAYTELSNYFSNPQHPINLPLKVAGTDFQKRVWQALREIPSGTTLTYGELAKKLKSSARAVGQACRRNPTPIIVPCHRVVGAKNMGGYFGETSGRLMTIKEKLLAHEVNVRLDDPSQPSTK